MNIQKCSQSYHQLYTVLYVISEMFSSVSESKLDCLVCGVATFQDSLVREVINILTLDVLHALYVSVIALLCYMQVVLGYVLEEQDKKTGVVS